MYLTPFVRIRVVCAFCFTVLFCISGNISSQDRLFSERAVFDRKASGVEFYATSLLNDAGVIAPEMRRAIPEGQLFSLDREAIAQLMNTRPENLSLNITYLGQEYTLDLVRYRLFSDGFRVSTSSGSNTGNLEEGLHYRGIIRDARVSIAAISVFSNFVTGILEAEKVGKLNLGPIEDDDDGRYIMYDINKVEGDRPPFECGVESLDFHPNPVDNREGGMRSVTNCVDVYLDCEHDMYNNNGSSVQQTVDKMTSIWNVVALLYQNEEITANISEIHVWDTPDSYSTTSTSAALSSFRSQNLSYNGDLAHLISRGAPSGGGVAWVDQLCGSYGYAYSYIYNSFNQYPSYSWTIEVITHEMGHNLGSWHTHDCVWNGNNTALDGCGPAAGYDGNGSCPAGPLPSSGTIMSYCHLVGGVGIDFTNGFGTQPGNLIRNEVQNASCLEACVSCEQAGQTCDDGDACTINDIYDSNCNCAGTFQDSDGDGVCDADDQCPGSDDSVDIDNDNIPDGCDACIDVDEDGECAASDPDDNDACTPDPLDENCSPCTDLYNDSFEVDFGVWNDGGNDCQITPSYPNTGSYSVQLRDDAGVSSSMFTDVLDMSGYDEVSISFSYYARSMDNSNEDFWLQYSLNGGSSYTTYEEWNYGDEFVNEERYDETVTFAGVSFTANTRFRFICDASANNDWVYIDDVVIEGCIESCVPGGTCDDGDPCTVNDAFDSACQCAGTFADSDGDGVCDGLDQCPGTDDSIIGTSCDDGDPCTDNDTYDSSCNCTGVLQDADGDGVCDTDDQCPGQDDGLIGTSCDDNDPCTENDVYDNTCTCAGVYADSDGDGVCDGEDQCPDTDDSIIGTACDDGDPCTINDTYDANCNCVGTPSGGTQTYPVTEDAYGYADDPAANYGSASTVTINAIPPKRAAEGYLQFDISGAVPGGSAILRLHVVTVNNAPQDLLIHAVSDDSWDESSLTWNNRPAIGSQIAAVSVSPGTTYDLDVTAYVQGEIADGTASFGLVAGGNKEIDVSSKEGIQGAELILSEPCGGSPEGLSVAPITEKLKIYPNPARDFVTVSYRNPGSKEITLFVSMYALTGELLYKEELDFSEQSTKTDISTRQFASGTYLIKVTDGFEVRAAKVMVTR